jgi:hypothetical protein
MRRRVGRAAAATIDADGRPPFVAQGGNATVRRASLMRGLCHCDGRALLREQEPRAMSRAAAIANEEIR